MRHVFAIDIGGTAIKYGLIGEGGVILARGEKPFERHLPFAGVIDQLAGLYESVTAAAGPADAIGVAMPGYALRESGLVVDGGNNVPALRDGSVSKALEQRLGRPVWFENDGVAAAMGEQHFGAGRTFPRFVLMTMGTGVGGAVVLDGKPVTGARGEPPELGAIIVGSDAQGAPVSLEAAASATGILRAYAGQAGGGVVSSRALFERAEAGDLAAIRAIDAASRSIAQAAGTLINALGLDAAILGGGVSGAGEFLAERVRTHLPAYTWPFLAARAQVRIAELGNSAGLLGVAASAFAGLAGENGRKVRPAPVLL
ncbi:ROK family protein [Bosea caraganae]|uniref:ROK family protein n=1 Tax=Bosea caraganae TaxID=2763117 RepID=A0A370KYA5_9HYPH|nr:ROK family protein [Bosea caraganae]RDJ19979.1 ROK family protein [Bosea caraganae]RDJ23918.1 ROK family protein [Bosea caraganae]